MKNHYLDIMVKPLLIPFSAIAISLIPYVEEGLRLSTLAVGLAYTCYKFHKEYKQNKKK